MFGTFENLLFRLIGVISPFGVVQFPTASGSQSQAGLPCPQTPGPLWLGMPLQRIFRSLSSCAESGVASNSLSVGWPLFGFTIQERSSGVGTGLASLQFDPASETILMTPFGE